MDEIIIEGAPLNINYFTNLVDDLYSGSNNSNDIILEFQKRSDSWLFVEQVIEESNSNRAKFLLLTIFSTSTKKKWESLTEEQKDYFKNYFFKLVINWSINLISDDLLNASNRCLLEILKNEWPFNWPNFISDFIKESKNNILSSINCLKVLSLLSQDINEFSDEFLTTERIGELQNALDNDFMIIFSFIDYLFSNNTNENLLSQSLLTFSHYLNWIDLKQVIKSDLCEKLVNDLLPNSFFRISVFSCFSSIASHISATADNDLISLFNLLIININNIIGESNNIFNLCINEDIKFSFSQTLNKFLLMDSCGLLQGQISGEILLSIQWLLQISFNCSRETLKICVETWLALSSLFFLHPYRVQPIPELIIALQNFFITKMEKPLDFNIFENIEDNSIDQLYENMRISIVYLSNLSRDSMYHLLTEKILNCNSIDQFLRFCWAIGAVSGSFPIQQESKFLINILNHLLSLIIDLNNNEESFIFFGCFIYVSSQYPRFLFNNWYYLNLVLEKIFQSFQIKYYPLQNLSIICLKNISNLCYKQLLITHSLNSQPFVNDWINQISKISETLYENLIPLFYESLSITIKHHINDKQKAEMVSLMLIEPVKIWESVLEILNSEISTDLNFSQKIIFSLDIFSKIIHISDSAFYPEIEDVIKKSIFLFNFYSEEINQNDSLILFEVKGKVLQLFESFFSVHPNSFIVPELIKVILNDYYNSTLLNKFYQSIDCITEIIKKLKNNIEPFINLIIDLLILPTKNIIEEISDNYPEICLSYFKLLSNFLTTFFLSIENFNINFFTIIINSLLWGISIQQHNTSSIALSCLSDIITTISNLEDIEFRTLFYSEFFFKILLHLIEIITNNSFTFLFLNLSLLIQHLLIVSQNDGLKLNENVLINEYICNIITNKLIELFPNINFEIINNFSFTLFNEAHNSTNFKDILRNFLILTKKISPSNKYLFNNENNNNNLVLGLTGPAEPEDFNDFDNISEF